MAHEFFFLKVLPYLYNVILFLEKYYIRVALLYFYVSAIVALLL